MRITRTLIAHSCGLRLVELICVPPADVEKVWPFASPLLKAAVERTGLSDWPNIERDVLYGHGLLWLAWSGKIEAAATTSLQRIGDDLICVLTACGGDGMERWLQLLAGIETYARNERCKCVRIFGREGWRRALEGYDVTNIVLEKAL